MVAGRNNGSYLASPGDRTPTGYYAGDGYSGDMAQAADGYPDTPLMGQSSFLTGSDGVGVDWEENQNYDHISPNVQYHQAGKAAFSPQARHSDRSPGADMRTRSLSGNLFAGSSTAARLASMPLPVKERITDTYVPAWCDRRLPAGKVPKSPRKAFLSNGPRRGSALSPGVLQKTFFPEVSKGDISLCVRLRPPDDDEICACVDGPNAVRLVAQSIGPNVSSGNRSGASSPRFDTGEAIYPADHVFGPNSTQEEVYNQAVTPICDAVINGYNGAVIAYGQTGSGKTYTMFGSMTGGSGINGKSRGIAPRAVTQLFDALSQQSCWSVEVSVLEIYNERVRDLLAPGPGVTHVEIHEVPVQDDGTTSFRCPQATCWQANCPDEALAALAEGLRRRETARTDMNHTSSRSHLVFTLCTSQTDNEIHATLRGRLHLVDLAGSERLKRSMSSERTNGRFLVRHNSRPPGNGGRTPRDQVREAGEINKSLSQLALVIQRLTGPSSGGAQYIPYRDSMLTRLLAESFGGSSQTCLIIAASPSSRDRDETRCSLEFGKRAKLVRNKAEINIEMQDYELSPVMQAMVAKELEKMRIEREAVLREREALLAERTDMRDKMDLLRTLLQNAVDDALCQQQQRNEDVSNLQAERKVLKARLVDAREQVLQVQQSSSEAAQRALEERCSLSRRLHEVSSEVVLLQQEREVEAQRHKDEVRRLQTEAEGWCKLLEEKDRESSTLQAEVRRLGREKADAVSRLEAENASLRERWAEDVARLGQEKAEVLERMSEQNALAQKALQEALRRRDRSEASRLACPTEVEQDVKQAEEEASLFAQFCHAQRAEANAQLEAATRDAGKCKEEVDMQTSHLEAEGLQLRKKWQANLERITKLSSVARGGSAAPWCAEFHQSDSTPSVMAEAVSSTADLASGVESIAPGDSTPSLRGSTLSLHDGHSAEQFTTCPPSQFTGFQGVDVERLDLT
mmetsp:Transcript_65799/g.122709  ORF Transcript_65799/g.122709 Transcript_65799/m.122709 type:complete len:970 (-) Transcript_65799:71-2980(-)